MLESVLKTGTGGNSYSGLALSKVKKKKKLITNVECNYHEQYRSHFIYTQTKYKINHLFS